MGVDHEKNRIEAAKIGATPRGVSLASLHPGGHGAGALHAHPRETAGPARERLAEASGWAMPVGNDELIVLGRFNHQNISTLYGFTRGKWVFMGFNQSTSDTSWG